MVYKRYSSPFEEPVRHEHTKKRLQPENKRCAEDITPVKINQGQSGSLPGILDGMACDDIILLGLIVILLAENKESRDVPLILTLGFLFLIQYIDAD